MNNINKEYICDIDFFDDFDNHGNLIDNYNEEAYGEVEFKSLGLCQIYVYSGEGPTPHFHICKNNNDVCCICLCKASYFDHGKNRSFKKLNRNQRGVLNEYLKLPYDNNNTIWEFLCISWLDNNNDINYHNKTVFPKEQPNYLDLNKNPTTKGR